MASGTKKIAIAVVVVIGVAVQIIWAVTLITPVVYLIGVAAGVLVGF